MKKNFMALMVVCSSYFIAGQTYPDPEFSNEIYLLKKEDNHTLVRLEKNLDKMDSKTKLGGFGGAESSFMLLGEKAPLRISNGSNLSFVYSTGPVLGSELASSPTMDSTMRSHGMDPAMLSMMDEMMDPAKMITLYKMEIGNGKRKIMLQKSPGAFSLSPRKSRSSDKYSFSTKKIREGYWELLVDKKLSSGEYAFSMLTPGIGSEMESLIFAFGVE